MIYNLEYRPIKKTSYCKTKDFFPEHIFYKLPKTIYPCAPICTWFVSRSQIQQGDTKERRRRLTRPKITLHE